MQSILIGPGLRDICLDVSAMEMELVKESMR